MQKKLNKIISLPCEESEKGEIAARIKDYLVDNDDYNNGNILLDTDRFETVDIIIYEGCTNVAELTKVLTMM